MSETNPLISIIIPTFNRAYCLERALKSVFNQTYKNFELIVVDDGSTDNTEDIMKRYPSAQYIKISNQGVSKARNIGISKAAGKWIALLDSDDEWHEDKLQQQLDYLAKNQDLRCVHGNEIWIRNNVRVNQMNKHTKGGGDQFIPSLKLCLISPSSVMIKKDLIEELGYFNEDYPVCEDYDLWLKLTSLYPVGYIEDFIINKYGGHEDQLSYKFFAMDYFRVKSINWILKNRELSEDKKIAAIKVIKSKCKILLKGYIKHNNLTNYDEIKSISEEY